MIDLADIAPAFSFVSHKGLTRVLGFMIRKRSATPAL